MQKDIDTLFSHLWDNYIKVTPSALKVHALLGGGEPIINDHVAFRTYNLPKLGLEKLAAHFLASHRDPGLLHPLHHRPHYHPPPSFV